MYTHLRQICGQNMW